MKKSTALAALIVLAFAYPVAALAADIGSPIVIPYGTWFSAILSASTPLIAGIAVAVLHRVMSPMVALFISDSAITNAVNAAIAQVADAAHGQELTVEISNKVLAAAAAYMVREEPAVAKQLGASLGPRLLAELSSLGVLPEAAVFAPVAAPY